MTDKELLEFAAKAAGIGGVVTESGSMIINEAGKIWSPLTDDGDALRMAVKLEMALDLTIAMQIEADVGANNVDEQCKDDPYSATRRAIVKAAAEIGKDMK